VIYVDSNVLIDILDADPDWQGWSQGQLEAARMAGPVVAGAIVAAEVGHFAESAEQVTRWFAALGVALAPASFDAAYRAGQASTRRAAASVTRCSPTFWSAPRRLPSMPRC